MKMVWFLMVVLCARASLGSNSLEKDQKGWIPSRLRIRDMIVTYPYIEPLIKSPLAQWPNHELGGTGIKGIAAHHLAKAISLNAHLRYLGLSHCELGDEEGMQLIPSLSLHPTLEEIDLSYNNFGVKVHELIIDMIESSPRIHALRLDLTHFFGEMATNLLKAAFQSSTLKSLHFDFNRLDEEAITQLDSLQPNMALEALSLAGVMLSSKGLSVLARHLNKLSCLRKLDLGWNNFEDIDMQYLAKIVYLCPTLETIDLRVMPLSQYGISYFQKTLLSYPEPDDRTTVKILLGFGKVCVARQEINWGKKKIIFEIYEREHYLK